MIQNVADARSLEQKKTEQWKIEWSSIKKQTFWDERSLFTLIEDNEMLFMKVDTFFLLRNLSN